MFCRITTAIASSQRCQQPHAALTLTLAPALYPHRYPDPGPRYIQLHTYAYMRTHAHTRTHEHIHKHIHKQAHAHRCRRTYTSHTHAMHIQYSTYLHTYTYTYIHTHTYIHTYIHIACAYHNTTLTQAAPFMVNKSVVTSTHSTDEVTHAPFSPSPCTRPDSCARHHPLSS